jgi:hypothetical protein
VLVGASAGTSSEGRNMSGVLLVVEAVGITAAAVGVVLAQNPPEDLRSWLDRQEWLHRLVMPMADDGNTAQGLSILPWTDEAQSPQDPAANTPNEANPDPLSDTA